MAKCIGCGLEVNNGILEVAICDGSALVCDPDCGLKLVAGCGLNSVDGTMSVDPCTSGGIICGATDDDAEDDCIFVNVQGQGSAVCTPLATAQDACPSPNCNGLVRTCDGLWAPPKTYGTYSFALDQDAAPAGPINAYLRSIAGGIPDLPGSVGDGFAPPSTDSVVTNNPNYEVMFHSFDFADAITCGLEIYGNTFSTFSLSYFVKAGELWRFLLWERVGFITPAQMAGPATIAGSPLLGTGWALQASFYIDRRNDAGGPFLETIQMNDVSSSGGGSAVRWEYMITANRLVGAGALDNNMVGTPTRQYRLTMNTAHCRPPEASSGANIPGPIQTFP